MMSNKQFNSLFHLEHLFGVGQTIEYASFITKYDWFDDILSIESIVPPTYFEITSMRITPCHITLDDKLIISTANLPTIIRKYHLELILIEKHHISIPIYESTNKEINIILGDSQTICYIDDNVLQTFTSMIINHMKAKDVNITYEINDNYLTLLQIYKVIELLYPEQII